MATLGNLNTFNAGTPALSSEVNANFVEIKNFVEGISVGTNIDNNVISLAKLATAVQNALVPVGTIMAYAGPTAPVGWLLCNGSSTTGYPTLASLVGSTTPNLQGKTLVGKDTVAPFNGSLLSSLGSTSSVAAHSHSVSGTAANTDITHGHSVNQSDAGHHSHSWSTSGTGAHQHQMDVDQLDSAVSHGHGTDGTLASGTSATPEGSTSAYTVTSGSFVGNHSHSGETSGAGSHNHGVSINGGGGSHGHSVSGTAATVGDTHGNVQPSVLVNYIIKHD